MLLWLLQGSSMWFIINSNISEKVWEAFSTATPDVIALMKVTIAQSSFGIVLSILLFMTVMWKLLKKVKKKLKRNAQIMKTLFLKFFAERPIRSRVFLFLNRTGASPGTFSQYPVRREWFRPKTPKSILVLSGVL